MTAATASEALRNAYGYSTCAPGRCLAYVRTWLEIGPRYYSAANAWQHTQHKHPGDRNVPAGAPLFWTGGSSGFGHIALSTGDGYVRSTDVPLTGWVRTIPLDWFDTHWPNLHYAGWAEDLNDQLLPYLHAHPPIPPKPPVHPAAFEGDTMLVTHDDNGQLTYWLLNGGKRSSVSQADAATHQGEKMTIAGPNTWTEFVQNYPTV